ncbi:M20 family metallopeptidase [Amycolatopsis sp. NPDC004625]|uniref:M20 family metallopeptidase n=1 Tax=Amycolatopsis sp. NPDC004625 TaxID=3154670 RepID=UPI0033BCD64E
MDLSGTARAHVDSGALFTELARLVAYPTVSDAPEGRAAIQAYFDEVLTPALTGLGCEVTQHANPDPTGGPFLVGVRTEGPDLPTLLCYGHADVVGEAGEWGDGRGPWTLTAEGDHWYGRGTADNKGQHLINLTALRLVLAERGRLGFNLKFLFETGEEIGSPGLTEFAGQEQDLLAADVLIASDGPRLDAATPTVFLGARGGVRIDLDVDLRPGGRHSGNWGGILRNPATTLAAAIASLVDGHGRIRLPELLPPELPGSVRAALADVVVEVPDPTWGDHRLTPAERLYGWNTLEVLSLGAADVDRPVNAIPGRARAVLQLRYVAGTDVDGIAPAIRKHLAEHGFPMVSVRTEAAFRASRTPVDNPWASWAKSTLDAVADRPVALLPSFGGGLPNHVFTDVLGLATLWLPHSYPGCRQHAPDEHLLAPVARDGLVLATALFDAFSSAPPTPRR